MKRQNLLADLLPSLTGTETIWAFRGIQHCGVGQKLMSTPSLTITVKVGPTRTLHETAARNRTLERDIATPSVDGFAVGLRIGNAPSADSPKQLAPITSRRNDLNLSLRIIACLKIKQPGNFEDYLMRAIIHRLPKRQSRTGLVAMSDIPSIEVPTGDPSVSGVFVSHVHEDRNLAEAFTLLIRDITAGSVAAYSSSDNTGDSGIKYGSEWFSWIKEKVEVSDHIVALLTPHSVGRPWILFEAGLGKAKPQSSVFGLALGIGVAEASVGPFGVFQNSASDRNSLIKLCKQLISSVRVNPRDEVIGMMVDGFLSKVEAHFSALEELPAKPDDPKTAAIFQSLEDLKFLLRERSETVTTKSRRYIERDLMMFVEDLEDGRERNSLRTAVVAALAEESGLVVEAEVLRQLSGRKFSTRDLRMAEQLIMSSRRSGGRDERVFDLVRHEFINLTRRVRHENELVFETPDSPPGKD
jgi:hypothetical protein